MPFTRLRNEKYYNISVFLEFRLKTDDLNVNVSARLCKLKYQTKSPPYCHTTHVLDSTIH